MGTPDIAALVDRTAAAWVDDPTNDVVYTEHLEGRTAVRVAQQTRDFTTIWFEVGDRTLSIEAYVLPPPPHNREEVFRQCLYRNRDARRVHFCVDPNSEIYLRGRLPVDRVDSSELDAVLAEVYELIEISFRPLIRAGFGAR